MPTCNEQAHIRLPVTYPASHTKSRRPPQAGLARRQPAQSVWQQNVRAACASLTVWYTFLTRQAKECIQRPRAIGFVDALGNICTRRRPNG